MRNDIERAQQYRYRAEELRAISASWLEEDARHMLERVACDYERMATVLEQRMEAGEQHAAIFCNGGETRQ
jgi:hypothetical protein